MPGGNGTCDGYGTGLQDHCCYLNGRECIFLERGTELGRNYSCGLKRELGDWEKVHVDPRYLQNVKPIWDRFGVADCGDWPRKGELNKIDSGEWPAKMGCCMRRGKGVGG